MNKLGRLSTVATGIILVILGVILRWDLVDWLIDVAGLLLIIIGVILIIFRLVTFLIGNKR